VQAARCEDRARRTFRDGPSRVTVGDHQGGELRPRAETLAKQVQHRRREVEADVANAPDEVAADLAGARSDFDEKISGTQVAERHDRRRDGLRGNGG
jgi:hypothetical protein